ncbi:MAG TPA: heme ABC exporter ATP-binding protein CcmA [Miltoncostaeaceae bacterium]|nr:heme ABC exporter ATP-binding protein CcmA [Miltoncostaeaceae bacterium]
MTEPSERAVAGDVLLRGRGLTRRFGERTAVDGVDIELRRGERLVVLGANGAGKSTLLRIIATLLRPEAGELTVCGHPCPEQAAAARGHIGLLGHEPMLYRDLSAVQNLEFFADLHGLGDMRERIMDALERVGLLARTHDPVRTFSRGMAQRLGLARVLLAEPELLLLDEPHAGLDAPGLRLLDAEIGAERPDRGILMVTHEVRRGVALADRAMVLRRGRCVLDESVTDVDPEAFARRYEELIA